MVGYCFTMSLAISFARLVRLGAHAAGRSGDELSATSFGKVDAISPGFVIWKETELEGLIESARRPGRIGEGRESSSVAAKRAVILGAAMAVMR